MIYGLIAFTVDVLAGQGGLGHIGRPVVITSSRGVLWLDFLKANRSKLIVGKIKIDNSLYGARVMSLVDLSSYRSLVIDEAVGGWPNEKAVQFAELIVHLVWKGVP